MKTNIKRGTMAYLVAVKKLKKKYQGVTLTKRPFVSLLETMYLTNNLLWNFARELIID